MACERPEGLTYFSLREMLLGINDVRLAARAPIGIFFLSREVFVRINDIRPPARGRILGSLRSADPTAGQIHAGCKGERYGKSHLYSNHGRVP